MSLNGPGVYHLNSDKIAYKAVYCRKINSTDKNHKWFKSVATLRIKKDTTIVVPQTWSSRHNGLMRTGEAHVEAIEDLDEMEINTNEYECISSGIKGPHVKIGYDENGIMYGLGIYSADEQIALYKLQRETPNYSYRIGEIIKSIRPLDKRPGVYDGEGIFCYEQKSQAKESEEYY
ncbi:hypothetical protein QJ850_gp868 [Acanthamoeba polyphaga mimivirus]|uniref:Uncharacterized protein n=1 Tax=Acanthamoeba polyphaga mimivirus Kroon TaxID=3069720 RepID=A0A0G2Y9M4_9VIRU|nr:hypothetical protein QJ850_gp868 [Acanthamoeba polyphaga mimivirus]AKI79831.1 hypothetical protein [Acanthamoeba polyphaga mimivirus Kroon]